MKSDYNSTWEGLPYIGQSSLVDRNDSGSAPVKKFTFVSKLIDPDNREDRHWLCCFMEDVLTRRAEVTRDEFRWTPVGCRRYIEGYFMYFTAPWSQDQYAPPYHKENE